MSTIEYSSNTIKRAIRAWRCSPFTPLLLQQMYFGSVELIAIAGPDGHQNRYTTTNVLELDAEAQLMWLIRVGLLRREVDGQGLTDRFRLTPLGRQLADRWQESGRPIGTPSLGAQLLNFVSRWLRLL